MPHSMTGSGHQQFVGSMIGEPKGIYVSMIRFELLSDAGVLIVQPTSALSVEDFRGISRAIDPHILERGKLTGLLIDAPSFPGWDNFGALIDHLKFVYDHHRKIERVAVVTDNAFLKVAPSIARTFVHPEIKVFASGEKERALAWAQSGV